MRTLACALPLCGASWHSDAAAAGSARVWTYQYLLATAYTERELAPITEHIIEDELPETELTDFAAEVLLFRVGDPNFPLQNKLRLLRVLGAARSRRYDAVLARVREQVPDPPVASWAYAAKPRWFSKDDAEYVPGTIDVAAFVAAVEAAALAAKPTTEQGRHLAQFPGGSIDELFAWAGRPHHIVSGQIRAGDGIVNVKVQRIAFYYRGLGRVVYGYRRLEGDWLFQAVVADPLAFEEVFPYRERARELGLPDAPTLEMMQLVSNYTAALKNVLQVNYRRESRPLEFLDTAAEILASQFESANDPVTVDTYAWICRLLSQHGGPRYAAVLQRVAAETPDDKLKRFAQLPIAATREVPAEPYVPGTVSLAAQRAKYLPPYPESTFQSGRL